MQLLTFLNWSLLKEKKNFWRGRHEWNWYEDGLVVLALLSGHLALRRSLGVL
jgi:hypothetical protein